MTAEGAAVVESAEAAVAAVALHGMELKPIGPNWILLFPSQPKNSKPLDRSQAHHQIPGQKSTKKMDEA